MESRWQTALRVSIPPEELGRITADARPEDGRWSQVEMLLCTVIEVQQQMLQVLIAANGGTPPEFKPIRRPGVTPQAGRSTETPDEKAARRAAMKARIDGTKPTTT